MWHVSPCSGVATLRTAIHLLLTLLTYLCRRLLTATAVQARRNVFVIGGYKFVRTLYSLVVKVVFLIF